MELSSGTSFEIYLLECFHSHHPAPAKDLGCSFSSSHLAAPWTKVFGQWRMEGLKLKI